MVSPAGARVSLAASVVAERKREKQREKLLSVGTGEMQMGPDMTLLSTAFHKKFGSGFPR